MDFPWDRVLFSDETTFLLHGKKSKTWYIPPKKKALRTIKHPAKVHVWACFAQNGFGQIYFFTSNLNSEKMCEIYKKALLPSVAKLFPKNTDWYLQEDNDPKHGSKLAMDWKMKNEIEVIQWPSCSPDQNPIENLWQILKMKMSSKQVNTIKGLKSEIKKAWNQLPKDLAYKLAQSMKKRLKALVDAGGDYTMY